MIVNKSGIQGMCEIAKVPTLKVVHKIDMYM